MPELKFSARTHPELVRQVREWLATSEGERSMTDVITESSELTKDALRIIAAFDARRFPTDGVERVLGHLRALLEAMAEDPGRRLADLPWVGDRHSDPLSGDWGAPADNPALDDSIPDLDGLDESELDGLIERLRRAETA